MKFSLFVLLFLLASPCVSCHSDGCKPLDTRCTGSVAEICDNDGNWNPLQDCSQVATDAGVFVCALADSDAGVEGHTCVSPEQP